MNEQIKLPGRPWKDQEEKACASIQMRVTEQRKDAYKKAAGVRGLSAWIQEQCDKGLK